jgi:hypothetical protein
MQHARVKCHYHHTRALEAIVWLCFQRTRTAAPRPSPLQPVYGLAAKDPSKFVRATGHPDVFFVQDRELSFDQVRTAAAGPACAAQDVNRRQPL